MSTPFRPIYDKSVKSKRMLAAATALSSSPHAVSRPGAQLPDTAPTVLIFISPDLSGEDGDSGGRAVMPENGYQMPSSADESLAAAQQVESHVLLCKPSSRIVNDGSFTFFRFSPTVMKGRSPLTNTLFNPGELCGLKRRPR